MAVQVARLCAVLALLIAAVALATPKRRLPLALRGVLTILKRDGTIRTSGTVGTEVVPVWKRLVAFVLVVLAVFLAVI